MSRCTIPSRLQASTVSTTLTDTSFKFGQGAFTFEPRYI